LPSLAWNLTWEWQLRQSAVIQPSLFSKVQLFVEHSLHGFIGLDLLALVC
jgi:hypothetical protein